MSSNPSRSGRLLSDPFGDDVFIGRIVNIPDHGSWRLDRKIDSAPDYNDSSSKFREVKAVFECTATAKNKHTDKVEQAIMKVFMRVRSKHSDFNGKTIGDYEASRYSFSHVEIANLEELIDQGCTACVKWATLHCDSQDERMPFPGEFVGYLLMEKLPGRTLVSFYDDFSRKERDDIREAFRKAISEVHDCGVFPNDRARRNIMWDAESKRCFIIDYEDCWGNSLYPKNKPYQWGLGAFDNKTQDWVDDIEDVNSDF